MKKILAFALVCAMMFTLTACGNGANGISGATKKKSEEKASTEQSQTLEAPQGAGAEEIS